MFELLQNNTKHFVFNYIVSYERKHEKHFCKTLKFWIWGKNTIAKYYRTMHEYKRLNTAITLFVYDLQLGNVCQIFIFVNLTLCGVAAK